MSTWLLFDDAQESDSSNFGLFFVGRHSAELGAPYGMFGFQVRFDAAVYLGDLPFRL